MEQWVREQYAEISPENCILLNKMLGICPRIKKAVSLLSSIPQGNPQLSLRSSLTPCTQYYMGGGAIPFRFSPSLPFLSLVVLVINLSDFFLIKQSNGKKTAAFYWQRIFVWTKFTAWNCARVRCKFMLQSRSIIQHCLVERTSSCDGRFSTGL